MHHGYRTDQLCLDKRPPHCEQCLPPNRTFVNTCFTSTSWDTLQQSEGEKCVALGQDVPKKSTAEFRYKKFRGGITEVKDGQQAGRPRSINRALVVEAIEDNPPFSTRIPNSDVRRIMDCLRQPPHKQAMASSPPEANTGAKPSLSEQKVMLCVWWWVGGIIHWELVASGHTINADIYSMQLQRVNDKMRQAGLWHPFRSGPILQQNNAQPHTAHLTLEKSKS
ncbi:transposase [Ancylostoma duodenale]|uniref:Transposase n=1 Tax=Ancylostoma duodenale TaxID=51022 RepID=A0A0C2DN39_9BILA|nr:transposase [Ancylostoma duodenale]